MSINQYLTFKLEKELYAINVENIQEVLEFQSVSKIPKMPDYMRGIINLRGHVVPVLDMKMKFGLGQTEKSIETSIIVTEMKLGEDEIVIGLLSDSVSEVIDIDEDKIAPPPNIGTKVDSSFIKGMGKYGEDFIIILNIDKILSSNEISKMTGESSTSVQS